MAAVRRWLADIDAAPPEPASGADRYAVPVIDQGQLAAADAT